MVFLQYFFHDIRIKIHATTQLIWFICSVIIFITTLRWVSLWKICSICLRNSFRWIKFSSFIVVFESLHAFTNASQNEWLFESFEPSPAWSQTATHQDNNVSVFFLNWSFQNSFHSKNFFRSISAAELSYGRRHHQMQSCNHKMLIIFLTLFQLKLVFIFLCSIQLLSSLLTTKTLRNGIGKTTNFA